MRRKVKRVILASLLSISGLLILLSATAIILVRGVVCDVHDQDSSLSPDGIWRATWSTEGCSAAALLTVYFDSKVTVSKTTLFTTASYLVFESDSPDRVAFAWPERDKLRIEVPSVANIVRSERSVPGLSVSYGVQESALLDLDNRQSIALRKKGAPEDPHLSVADRKIEERVDDNYRNYLDQFRTWTRDYALPPPR
jgi:hypothetical protein